jgi:phosphatidylserine/phosphatidylglycerophosphate/cardiolipin synthase-like enzyme
MGHHLSHRASWLFVLIMSLAAGPAAAQDRLCDPGGEDCRAILIGHIRAETVAIDVSFWFMEDARYTAELIKKWNAGVPVRVLIDPRANVDYPLNTDRLRELQTAGIPMRRWLGSSILHWKMMLFHGQNVVEFSGANYSAHAWRPGTTIPYQNYVDEVIYFTSDTAIVDSFRTKFDDQWIDPVRWADYANITTPPARSYSILPKDPSLNFPPWENFRTRSVDAFRAEQRKIDAIMYRITDRGYTDGVIAAAARGVQVRLITEPQQYRYVSRIWHSWNVDRLYMAGVDIKHRAHAGLNHQKSVILYDQDGTTPDDQTMVIFGSSNWTSASASGQVEHNIFTTKPDITGWLVDQFERKWNNTAGIVENAPFVPLPPDAPSKPLPALGATGVASANLKLTWFGGPWAHLYDVYLDTSSNPSKLVATNLTESPSKNASSTFSYTLPMALNPGTKYYWKVVGKTMALRTRSSAVWSFTTAAATPPPPPPRDVVLYASEAPLRVGAWIVESDATAAGGARIRHPNAGAAKVATASATPANYFELTFIAEPGRPYRLWIRGKADSNNWSNDSVFVQFSNSVTAAGAPIYGIGTTSAADVNLEACSGCGVAGWGWQDNGYGTGVLGPLIYFAGPGPTTVRVQTREDGFAIDQIVLSHSTFITASPGALKNDTTILPK